MECIDKDKLLDGIECIDISDFTDVDGIFAKAKRLLMNYPSPMFQKLLDVRIAKIMNL